MPLEQARALVREAVKPLGTERVALANADGRGTAAPVIRPPRWARQSVPGEMNPITMLIPSRTSTCVTS